MALLEKGVPGYKRTIALIVFLGMAPPIATDVYLPALPQMTGVFNASESLVNLTLVGFFLFMAAGTLFLGPVSDKFGRKKPLIIATFLFSFFGFVSGISNNIWLLIAARVLQGIGGGGMVALSMALVKDCFAGRVREKVLVFIQAASMVSPMCAPLIGAVTLEFFDWRACFYVQAILGLVSLLLVLRMKEPLAQKDRIADGMGKVIGRLLVVGRNKSFALILFIVAILSLPFMGYISSVSYIYMGYFGLSSFEYSAFFAINAALSIVGAFLALALGGKVSVRAILSGVIVLSLASGVCVLLFGHVSPFSFLAFFGVYCLMGSVSRPFTTNILLEQQDGDTGSASSLINFTCSVSGSLGMMLATLPWPTYIIGLGVMIVVVSVLSLVVWVGLLKSKNVVRGL